MTIAKTIAENISDWMAEADQQAQVEQNEDAYWVALEQSIAQHTDPLEQRVAELEAREKRAPVSGYSGGIPWSMHLRAYDAYCKEHGPQKALIDLEGRNCRGGFHVDELDRYIPGWRQELCKIQALEQRVKDLEAENKRLREAMEKLPRTADDVPIIPGMEVWQLVGGRDTSGKQRERPVVEPSGKLDLTGVLYMPEFPCYSTKQAAEQALAEEPEQ